MNNPGRTTLIGRVTLSVIFALTVAANMGGCPGPVAPTNDNGVPDNVNVNDNSDPVGDVAQWTVDFDASGVGFVSAVWGSGPDDVFVVGGQEEAGEIFHYDGTTWQQMNIPDLPRLIWVFGFDASNVYAVGEGGGALHFDGTLWSLLDTPTDENLWGIWGSSPTDIWIVGGDTGDVNAPVILNFDGCNFETIALPDAENVDGATALFKVWGIGSKVFAVGSDGLIIELDADTRQWVQVDTGSQEDFVSLWGTSENNIVAVGGRSAGQISVYDGTSWTTTSNDVLPELNLGLNAVFMVDADQAVIGGVSGYAATYNPMTGELITEFSGTNDDLHGIWGDGAGLFHVVGGLVSVSGPSSGVALVRSIGDPVGFFGFAPQLPGSLPDPADPTLTFLNSGDESHPPEVIVEGSELTFFTLVGQGIVVHVEPVLRVTGFPAEAADGGVTITHSLSLVDDGRVIADLGPAFLSFSDAGCAGEGVFEVTGKRLNFLGDVAEEVINGELDLEGVAAELTVTIDIDGVTATHTETVTLTAGGEL